jgi:hypothetical protein
MAAIATTLNDVRRAAAVLPLQPGDPRYLDLTPGHGSKAMTKLRRTLAAAASDGVSGDEDGRFLKIVFTGHRGCGKTTELLRVERDFADRFFPVHLTLDGNLYKDLDYSLMLLWLAHGLAEKFAKDGMPLPEDLIEAVGRWFATSTNIDLQRIEASASAAGTASLGGGIGVLSFGLRLLAQVKSEARGSAERRTQISTTLQRYAGDLIDKVNSLLTEAQAILARNRRPSRLLIVQDNLDRLDREAAKALFIGNGDILKQLQADVVFTAPVSLALAPAAIFTVFAHTFNLPMIKLATRDGVEYQPGLETLRLLVARRVDLDRLFQAPDVVLILCRASGGSVRDLMRLLLGAAENAAIAGLDRIDADSAHRAIADLRVEFQGLLRPERYYFPRLAAIHRSRSDGCLSTSIPDGKTAEDDRRCLSELLLNGSVLEYNGDDSWFDVHPVVQTLKAFTRALEQTPPEA